MKYTWLVEKYLEGELSGRELSDFELLILRDQEVAHEVERVKSLLKFSREQHLRLTTGAELLESFDDFDNILDEEELELDLDNLKIRKVVNSSTYPDLSQKIRSSIRTGSTEMKSHRIMSLLKFNLWLTAASIALILTLSILFLNRVSIKTDYLALYNQYYHPFTPETNMRDAGPVKSSTYQQGIDEYMIANYSLALDYFTASISEDPDNPYNYLFQACALMELGDYRQALVSLEKLQYDRTLDDYGLWYSGLCHLKLDDHDQSKLLFRQLVEKESYFAPRAKVLLKKL